MRAVRAESEVFSDGVVRDEIYARCVLTALLAYSGFVIYGAGHEAPACRHAGTTSGTVYNSVDRDRANQGRDSTLVRDVTPMARHRDDSETES